MEGGTTFTFVTDGIEAALQQAKEAARGKDVSLAGGAKAAQQYLSAGLIDEMEIHLVPLLFGAGSPLFDDVGRSGVRLKLMRTIDGPGVTHLKYRVSGSGRPAVDG
jgi:dihydrofolate reductase